MTTASPPGRASALYRRAMDGIAESPVAEEAPPPERATPLWSGAVLPGTGVLAIASTGLLLGLALTAILLGRGWDPGAVAVGPWVTQPKVGTTAIDPYAQAGLARSGAVPLSVNEGLTFTATTDDTGYRLLRSCSYHLDGGMPPARFWTLSATGRDGLAIDDAARRSTFTSTDVIRDAEGHVAIDAAPEARPGNWLPLSGDGPLTLTLRLYDTPLTANTAEIGAAALPAITRLGCNGTVR